MSSRTRFASDTKSLANGTTLKGRYLIARLVGGGGMARVYEARETLPGGGTASWAIKELRSDTDDPAALAEARLLFEQEANILVRLRHPNLPRVSAFFDENDRSYLVMEFIHGESLEKRLENANAPMLEGQVVDWAIQICGVLSYLHTRPEPIIFRDMKPSNVMVTVDGRIKLIDFGIARVYKQGKLKDTITMGSENYAAPEQWGKAQTDARADVYGLGATLYHLLTNVPPLPAFVPTERVPIQQYNPAVTDRVVSVVETAMSKERDQRYASAADMREALLNCLGTRERRRMEARFHESQVAAPLPQETASQPKPALPADTNAPVAEPPVTAPRTLGPVYSKPCPSCQTLSRPEARFCRHCGHVFRRPLPPILALTRPSEARWEFPVRDEGAVIGRQGGAVPANLDVGFYDPEGFVSRNHACIRAVRRRHQIIDMGSANGTFVNGQRLAAHTPRWLRHGDRIRVGRIVLEFRIR